MTTEIEFGFSDIKLTGIKIQPGMRKNNVAEDDRVALVYITHVAPQFIC